jgi:Divergent InlB B-repeat domain
MKIKGLVGILVPVVALFACGGSSSGGSGSSGTGSGPLLSITVTAGGTVTSADGSINCSTSCMQTETAGAVVHLIATPAAGMQFTGWSGACSGTGSCDLTITADTTVGAAFAAQSLVAVEVELDGAGSGTVMSSPAGISCPGTCLMQAAQGTVITLTSTADAASHFDGYGGSTCQGTSCSFTVSTAAKIFASFSSTVVTATHTLSVTSTGNGTVSSNPAGIACPGACSAAFQQGAMVTLTATAAAGASFTGWSGACTGTGACSISMAGDAAVTATFSAVVADSCAGLMPALPDPQTAGSSIVGPGAECQTATSDGNGLVYVTAAADGAENITLTDPSNAQGGHVIESVQLLFPLQSGFVGTPAEAIGPASSIAYAPDGTVVSQVLLPGGDGTIQNRGFNANGGSIVLSITCSGTAGTFIFQRFDDANHVTSQSSVSDACPATGNGFFFPMIDLQNNTLVVNPLTVATASVAAGHFAARWFDSAGNPLTDWFDAGAIDPAEGSNAILRPLIGGGAALRAGDTWMATLPSGKGTAAPAPTFFEKDKDAIIALGGKAYAMIPDPAFGGSLDIFAASDGKSCGTLASTKVNPLKGENFTEFFVGKDGTLINTQGPANCTANYYPHLLK